MFTNKDKLQAANSTNEDFSFVKPNLTYPLKV